MTGLSDHRDRRSTIFSSNLVKLVSKTICSLSKVCYFLDPSLDSSQRIAVLQQKLSDLRKTYADVKTELAAVERRRKKIKRREREGKSRS